MGFFGSTLRMTEGWTGLFSDEPARIRMTEREANSKPTRHRYRYRFRRLADIAI